jgi:Raf kinase inhibitor-like YbhB/YbcL family protein
MGDGELALGVNAGNCNCSFVDTHHRAVLAKTGKMTFLIRRTHMKLTSPSFGDNEPIPSAYAFCAPDPVSHVTMSENRNPALTWSGVPAGTRSLVLTCHDPDVPSKPDDVNQEGRLVPSDLPRVDFFHWVLVDIPPTVAAIEEGDFSDCVTARGKDGSIGPGGARPGLNNYTDWFTGDADMEGKYFGYDGPCPPWNDSIVHHYVFTLYALDIERFPVEGEFGGAEVRHVIDPHILARASVTGTYSLNPDIGA